MASHAPIVSSTPENTDTNSVPSTDQFAMQDVRIAEYLIRNDGEPVDESAVDTSNNPEITPQEHVVVLHQNGHQVLCSATDARLGAAPMPPSPPPQLHSADLHKTLDAQSTPPNAATTGPSTNPRDVAPPGIVEAPALPPVTSIKDYPAVIARQLRDLASSNSDGPAIRTKITQISSMFDQLMGAHQHETLSLRRQVGSLKAERDRKAARDLTVDSFENSIDRLSEGQARSAVETLNSNMDELVMNITEEVSSIPPSKSSATFDNPKEPLMSFCSKLPADDERRGLLVETMLHQIIGQRLHILFFKGKVCSAYPKSDMLEKLYVDTIGVKETWKVAQKWRSVTSNAIDSVFDVNIWTADVQKTASTLATSVLNGLNRPASSLPNLQKTIADGLGRLYTEALDIAKSVRRDHVSARLLVVISPGDMKTIDLSRVEVQWADTNQDYKAAKSLGTYSFGLVKIGEDAKTTILLRPKVVADNLIRVEREAGPRHGSRIHHGSHPHHNSKSRSAPTTTNSNRETSTVFGAGAPVQTLKEGQRHGEERERKVPSHEGPPRAPQSARKRGRGNHSSGRS